MQREKIMIYDKFLKSYTEKYGEPEYCLYAGMGDTLFNFVNDTDIKLDKKIFLLPWYKYTDKKLGETGPFTASLIEEGGKNRFPTLAYLKELADKTGLYSYTSEEHPDAMAVFCNDRTKWEELLYDLLQTVCFSRSGMNVLNMDKKFWNSVVRCMEGMDRAIEIMDKRMNRSASGGGFKTAKFAEMIKKRLENRDEKTFLTDKEKYKWFDESLVILKKAISRELKEKHPTLSEFELLKAAIPGIYKAMDKYYKEYRIEWETFLIWWIRQQLNGVEKSKK